MRVTLVVDGRWRGHFGIGRYAAQILPRLPAADELTGDVPPASLRDPLYLRRELRRRHATAFFSPGYNAAASRVPQLLVLHDLIHLDVPAERSRAKLGYYYGLVRPVVRRTGVVVTVSEFSQRRICRWTGLSPDDVVVAPGAMRFEPADVADVPVRDGNPYVLFVGNPKPHKNLRLLVHAMDALPDLELVCVGVTDADVRAAGASAKTAERTTCLVGVDDRQLAGLYRDAQCLGFPSTYEGFGLPAREAMSLGTPVAHASEAVAETVGPDCGAGVSTTATPDQFAAAVRTAAELKGTAEFTAHAERQLARHTWDRSAALITAALERIAGRR